MRDFHRWYDWIINNIGYMEIEQARKMYEGAYGCNCVSCEYAREKGTMPTPQLNANCMLDVRTALNLEDRVRGVISRANDTSN